MLKKRILAILLIIVLITGASLFLLKNKFAWLDFVNPMVKTETSYARVPLKMQQYENIKVYDNQGEVMDYLVSFSGYDPTQEFVQLVHRGLFVKEITYKNKEKMPAILQEEVNSYD